MPQSSEGSASSTEGSDVERVEVDVDVQAAAAQVIRMVMAKEQRGSLVRREHITQVLQTFPRKLNFDKVLRKANLELETVYGMKLKPTPRLSTKAARPPLVLVSTLEDKSKEAIARILSAGDAFSPMEGTRLSKYDLTLNGIIGAILCMVVFSENNASEHEIFSWLEKLHITPSETSKIKDINMTSAELLSMLIKEEYLIKNNMNEPGKRSDLLVFYKLGRRAIVEFPPVSVLKYAQQLYGNKFSEKLVGQIAILLMKTYHYEDDEDVTRFVKEGKFNETTQAEQDELIDLNEHNYSDIEVPPPTDQVELVE